MWTLDKVGLENSQWLSHLILKYIFLIVKKKHSPTYTILWAMKQSSTHFKEFKSYKGICLETMELN